MSLLRSEKVTQHRPTWLHFVRIWQKPADPGSAAGLMPGLLCVLASVWVLGSAAALSETGLRW